MNHELYWIGSVKAAVAECDRIKRETEQRVQRHLDHQTELRAPKPMPGFMTHAVLKSKLDSRLK